MNFEDVGGWVFAAGVTAFLLVRLDASLRELTKAITRLVEREEIKE